MPEEINGSVRIDIAERDERETVRCRERYEEHYQVNRANIHDDGAQEAGEFEERTVVHCCEGFVFARFKFHFGREVAIGLRFLCLAAPEYKAEEDCLYHAYEHDEVRTAPEVEFIDGACGEAENSGKATDKRNCADRRDGFFTRKLEVVFAETDERLDDGNRARDACEEQHGEPDRLQEPAERERAEYVRHRLESKTERAELRAFLDVRACDKHCHRDDDRTADNHFGKSVRGASRERRKHEVLFRLEVACVAEDDGHAKAHRKEHLACRRHPNLGASEFRKIRVPHECKTLADARERKHADHKHEAQNQENRHANLVRTFNALAYAERKHHHVRRKCYQKEYNRYREASDAGFEHDVVAEEFLHPFGSLCNNVHQRARRRIERERQNPRLDESIVENDENRRE